MDHQDSQRGLLAQWIEDSSRIVFFGGAGVSTESGIPDFRGAKGFYHQDREIPLEQVIAEHLNWPGKRREGRFVFVCPRCGESLTAVNPRTIVVLSLPDIGLAPNFNTSPASPLATFSPVKPIGIVTARALTSAAMPSRSTSPVK